MRTSRPLKHAPRPLLSDSTARSNSNSKRKGRSQNSGGGGKQDAGQQTPQKGSKGKLKQAERRLEDARKAVRESDAAAAASAPRKSKGKQRAILNDEDEDSEQLEDGSEDIPDNTMDISNIKFKMGINSDDEDSQLNGDSDDDDEEIDSDLALTDGEEQQGGPSVKSKPNKKRQVASDFYSDDDNQLDIDLDEDAGPSTSRKRTLNPQDSDYNSEEDDEIYMDLSEMLDRKTDPVANTASTKSKKDSKKQTTQAAQSRTEVDLDEDQGGDLTSFKPSLPDIETSGEDSQDEEEVSSGSDEDDEDDEEEDLESDMDSDVDEDDDDDPEKLAKLEQLISGLPARSGKRSLEDGNTDADASLDASDALAKKKRRVLLQNERTEAVPEGEFVATSSSNGKLTLEAMLSSLSGTQADALKKSLRPLQSLSSSYAASSTSADSPFEAEFARLSADEAAILARERAKKSAKESKRGKTASGALPAPLAPLHQAKVERMAAKEKQEEEVKKWEDTVKAMKGIAKDGADDPEARLVLPLMSQGKGKGTSSAELVAKFTPSNDLENQISALIASTGMSQSSLLATESSALMSALPANVSEKSASHDAARTAQLRLARELMFRAERKAKRVAKIKSRTFRKIAKKSRDRAADAEGEGDGHLTMDEMAQLDALDGGSRAEAERERLETIRARERATLRHASGKSGATAGGRWSRSLKGMDGMDDDMKDAVRSRESKNELLRRKIMGNDEGDGSGSSGDEDDNDLSGASDEEQVTAKAAKELSGLRSDVEKKDLPKGLMGMKFMQKAMQRENDKVDRMIDDFDVQVGNAEPDADASIRGGDLVQNNPGRMVFAPGAQAGASGSASTSQIKKASASNTAKTNGNVSVTAPTASSSAASMATLLDYNPFSNLTDVAAPRTAAPGADINPWLSLSNGDASAGKVSRKTNEQIGGKNGRASDKSALKVQKEQGKSKEALKNAQAEARVEIDLDNVMLAAPSAPADEKGSPAARAPASSQGAPATSPIEVKKRQKRENAPPPSSAAAPRTTNGHADDDAESGSDNDSDALPESVKRSQGPQAFKQRDLVAQAFAGDNVVTDFEEMKRAEIAADAPKEEDLTLPGWGSWSGKGVRNTSKKQKEKQKHIKHIPGVEASDRKDAKFAHVVISERQDKKAKKYMTKDLPYPYTSQKQYEQRLAMPMGAEWNTRGTSREMTMPKVLTKPGAVIRPVSRHV